MRSVRDTNVSVVGGCGFLGSHLVDHLIDDRGCKVVAIDNLIAGRREFLHPKATFIHHDITGSEDYLREVFKHHGIRYVFSYAARPYIPDGFSRPLRTFDVNAMGALKVMNAAQEAGVEGILQVSSAEIYGDKDGEVCPHSTYGASKAAVDFLVQCRWKEAKTPAIAMRQYNCIGSRETHSYVVPEIIGQLSKFPNCCPLGISRVGNQPAAVCLGNNSFRDFQYAGDAVRMAVELLEKGSFGETYDMGSQDGIKIYDLAKLIGKLMGFKEVEIIQDPARIRPWEIWSLKANCEKLYATIDARPQVSFEEALKRTIEYYRSNGNKWCWE